MDLVGVKQRTYDINELVKQSGGPVKTIDKEELRKWIACPICLKPWASGATVRGNCPHRFHRRCMVAWQRAGGDTYRGQYHGPEGHRKCPVCREPFPDVRPGVLPEGVWIVSGESNGGLLKLWNVGTGECRDTWEGPCYGPACCAVSPDGQWIVSGAELDLDIIYLAPFSLAPYSERRRTLQRDQESVLCCAVSPNGTWIVSGSLDTTLKLWDVATGQCTKTLEGHTEEVGCCAISPDGTWIVSGSLDTTLKLWDVATGQCTNTLEEGGHETWIHCCAISPDGTWIVSGAGSGRSVKDFSLKLWNVATGQCTNTLTGHTEMVTCCAVNSDGTWIVSGGDSTLKVWDVATGQCTNTLEGHPDAYIECCAISPDDTWIVSGSDDNTLKVWDVATGQCIRTLEHNDEVLCCTTMWQT